MRNLSKEKLAMLTIYADAIHDILYENEFVTDLKQAFKNIENSTKYILKRCYGNQSLEESDKYRDKVNEFAYKLVDGNYKMEK